MAKHSALLNDEQPAVVSYAYDAQFDLMKVKIDPGTVAEDNDRKLAAEEAKKAKETSEAEEAKRRNIEELVNKAKAAFKTKTSVFKSNSYNTKRTGWAS